MLEKTSMTRQLYPLFPDKQKIIVVWILHETYIQIFSKTH